MDFKVNIRARLERHARNSHVAQKSSVFRIVRRFKVFSALVVLILPIYPSFGAFGQDAQTAVGDYDESTILFSYQDDGQEQSMFSQESGFVKPDASIDDTRDVSGQNHLVPYTVANGDSLSTISDSFNVSVNSILWANNLDRSDALKPGQVIQIPPVSGVVYRIAAGDTIQSVAEKFKIDASTIVKQNRLIAGVELKINDQLVIPGGVRLNTAAVADSKSQDKDKKTAAQIAKDKKIVAAAKAAKDKKAAAVKSSASGKRYAVKYTGNGRGFAWGNCTYYVANHKNVTWRGNANAWLRNAAAAGVPTGKTPAAGAIIALSGHGYNPYYGHVGIVADIDGDDVIIKDMNYRRLNEVTVRRISKDDPSIRGYIYSD